MRGAEQREQQERDQEARAVIDRLVRAGVRPDGKPPDGVFGRCAGCYPTKGKMANVNLSGRLVCWECVRIEKEREAGPLTVADVKAWEPGGQPSVAKVKARILEDVATIEEGRRVVEDLLRTSLDSLARGETWTRARKWLDAAALRVRT